MKTFLTGMAIIAMGAFPVAAASLAAAELMVLIGGGFLAAVSFR